MKDILQQIQNLKEDFMNLIEVEGLGQPASDVPPSTNKIKKDKKTKNGKVELVSVEDELFPYDGNKREQYRQKIIDTINGMIQGTATLEDLLQIVRQKKMPVKEGCEAALNRLRVEYDKESEGAPSGSKEMYELNKKYKKLEKKVKKHYDESLKEALTLMEDIHAMIDKHGDKIGAPLKEAMEVLENLYTSAARMKVNANSKGDFKKYELANKAIRTLNIKGDPQDKYLEDVKRRQGKKEANAQEDRALGDDTKFMKGFYKTRDKQEHVVDTGSPFLRNYGYSDNAVEKSIKRNKKKEQKKAPLKEAIELLETINVKDHKKYHGGGATFSYKGNDYSYSPERGLRKEGKTRDDRNPVKQIVDTENKEFDDVRKYKYDLGRQSRTVNKKLNKEIKELEKTEGKGAFPGKTNDTIKKLIDTLTVNSSNRADADKYFTEVNAKQKKLANDAKGVKYEAKDSYNTKKSDSFGVKPIVKTSEALEEALKLLEGIHTAIEKGAHEIKKPMLHAKAIMNYSNELQNAAKK